MKIQMKKLSSLDIGLVEIGVVTASSHRNSFSKYKYLLFFSRSKLFTIFQAGEFLSVCWKGMFFFRRVICLSNRHVFSRRVYLVFRADTSIIIYQYMFGSGFIEQTYFFKDEGQSVHRTDVILIKNIMYILLIFPETLKRITNFPGVSKIFSFYSSNRQTDIYLFSRKPYLCSNTETTYYVLRFDQDGKYLSVPGIGWLGALGKW